MSTSLSLSLSAKNESVTCTVPSVSSEENASCPLTSSIAVASSNGGNDSVVTNSVSNCCSDGLASFVSSGCGCCGCESNFLSPMTTTTTTTTTTAMMQTSLATMNMENGGKSIVCNHSLSDSSGSVQTRSCANPNAAATACIIQSLQNLSVAGGHRQVVASSRTHTSLPNSSVPSRNSNTVSPTLPSATFNHDEPVAAAASSSSSSIWTFEQRALGDVIYNELKREFPTHVAKLTGMILFLPTNQLNRLVASPNELHATARRFHKLLQNG
ncbi:hypothetical protein RFI_04711 [Reticulomyxa filosa]|uniref:PABC domain-containing protein n=1 Tax=Reticulomyxa filosa TaxID=46433 RepID=X6P1J8_RETFI|nr:hypothetical protein RFI_04711 [Reticulomyxa filosa]|eukprot:ETO32405.1 hypothetical protein RFI_04711 [Reticulomyxa filosa]